MWLHPDEKGKYKSILLISWGYRRMWSVKSSDIIDRLGISVHENLQTFHHWQPKWLTMDKLICAVESGKYEGATFVVGE